MAEEFGLEGAPVSIEIKDFLATERGMRAMEKGDLLLVAAAGEFADDMDTSTDWAQVFEQEVDKFKPDVLIWTPLLGSLVTPYTDKHPELPSMMATYQPHCIPTNYLTPINMQRLELEAGQPKLHSWVLEAQTSASGQFDACKYLMAEGKPIPMSLYPQMVWESNFNIEEAASPKLLAYSPGWWPALPDWPKKNVIITGNWKIRKEDQEAAALKGGQLFNAGGQHQACTDFINAGEKPVYIGWGSMMVYSKEHMARLAVGALKEAGKRGIIVGGWAELSAESLGGDEYEELKAYSRENVLFLKSAPHEWLFPQCACCVHHGGIGTTQASLSAGVPTVVTPVFADQKDIAKKLSEDKTGQGTVHLSQLTAAELGAKIRKCCDDPTIRQNCEKLREVMQKEDGVGTTVQFLEGFMKEVESGVWKKKQDALFKRCLDAWEKQKKLPDANKLMAKWNMDLADKYQPLQDYTNQQVNLFGKMVELFTKKKLWWVKSTQGCLARKGEALKSEECGRYKEFTLLEELEANKSGSRLRVRRLKGVGPDEAWVSPTVSGKDIIVKVMHQIEIQKIQGDALKKQFADIIPSEVKT